jgi:hypothetical protein
LPQSRRWKEVVELLAEAPADTARLGAAVIAATNARFIQLAKEQTLSYPLWLMARVALASRGTRFISDLNALGVQLGSANTALDVISAIAEKARQESALGAPAGHLNDFAIQALRSALTATVATQGKSLFEAGIRDAQRAFRDFSNPDEIW